MPHNSRIKPTYYKKNSNKIKPTQINETESVSFNFKRLRETKKFNCSGCTSNYFQTLIERLKNISNMSRKEMTIDNHQGLRCHPIRFNELRVTESSFLIPGREELDDEAWQFQLTTNTHGRVHGYFVDSIFYVVWLDPEHNLYK